MRLVCYFAGFCLFHVSNFEKVNFCHVAQKMIENGLRVNKEMMVMQMSIVEKPLFFQFGLVLSYAAFVKKAAKKIAIFRYLRTLHPNEKKLCVDKFIFDKKGKPWKCHFKNFCLSLTIHPLSLFTSKKDKNNCLRIQWRLVFGNVSHCSTLWLWVGYFIYFKFAPVLF